MIVRLHYLTGTTIDLTDIKDPAVIERFRNADVKQFICIGIFVATANSLKSIEIVE